MNFDIKTQQLTADAYAIALAGEVDLYTAPEFKQQLLEVIGRGADPGDRRLHPRDVHRLDHARRAGRWRQAPSARRRPAVARLQRPRTSSRSSRSPVSIASSTSLARATRPSPVSPPSPNLRRSPEERASHSPSCCWRSRLGLRRSRPGHGGRPAHGKQLFSSRPSRPSRPARRATRSPTPNPRARSGRTSTTRSRRSRPGVLGGADDPRRRPGPDRLSRRTDAGESLSRPGRARHRRLHREVHGQRELRGHRDDHRATKTAAPRRRRRRLRSPDGKKVFATAGCGGCHTLKDAGTTGNVGPNLDQLKPSERDRRSTRSRSAAARCRRSRASSPTPQIKAVATYVSSVAGK